MLINNLNVVFIKSSLTNRAVVVKYNEEFEVVVNLIDSCNSLIKFVKDSLERMEENADGYTDIYRYLFLCRDTGRYGLLYSGDPIVNWRLLGNNE